MTASLDPPPPVGKPCDWKGYKAVRLHNLQAIAASFQENNIVINWVNEQFACSHSHMPWRRARRKSGILSVSLPRNMSDVLVDWFHLMENLHKVGGSISLN